MTVLVPGLCMAPCFLHFYGGAAKAATDWEAKARRGSAYFSRLDSSRASREYTEALADLRNKNHEQEVERDLSLCLAETLVKDNRLAEAMVILSKWKSLAEDQTPAGLRYLRICALYYQRKVSPKCAEYLLTAMNRTAQVFGEYNYFHNRSIIEALRTMPELNCWKEAFDLCSKLKRDSQPRNGTHLQEVVKSTYRIFKESFRGECVRRAKTDDELELLIGQYDALTGDLPGVIKLWEDFGVRRDASAEIHKSIVAVNRPLTVEEKLADMRACRLLSWNGLKKDGFESGRMPGRSTIESCQRVIDLYDSLPPQIQRKEKQCDIEMRSMKSFMLTRLNRFDEAERTIGELTIPVDYAKQIDELGGPHSAYGTLLIAYRKQYGDSSAVYKRVRKRLLQALSSIIMSQKKLPLNQKVESWPVRQLKATTEDSRR